MNNFQQLLSVGSLQQILDGGKPRDPVMQIIGYKPMAPDQVAFGVPSDELRYRLMIGDGVKQHQYCVITNQDIVEKIKNGQLEKWSIVRITSYQAVDYGDGSETKRRLIYILDLVIVKPGSEVGQKIICPENSINQQQAHYQAVPAMQDNGRGPMQEVNHTPEKKFKQYVPEPVTQPQMYPVGGMNRDTIKSPRSMRENHSQTVLISELTPYISKFTIKGRITTKAPVREYKNARGEGHLINFTIQDSSGEIKVTAFNADCDRIVNYIETNKVYLVSRATVKAADKRYSSADYEMTLNNDSLVEEVRDAREASEVPQAKFNFVSIGTIKNLPPNQVVDLIGAIVQVSEFSTITSKTKNKELKKRNILIVDQSRHSISVTIWGDQAESFNGSADDIFVTKAARIGTYGGHSASAGDCFFINPDMPEVRKLRNWYSGLVDRNFEALTTGIDSPTGDQWKFLSEMLDMEKFKNTATVPSNSQQNNNQQQYPSQPRLYGQCKVTLLSVGKSPVYKCCPKEGCGKKLTDTQTGEMKCDKCQQTHTSYNYRYMTNVEIGDPSASCYVTLWDEKAETIFGMSAEDLEKHMRMENRESYDRIMTRPMFQAYTFVLRAKIDRYQDEERIRLEVFRMNPIKVEDYCHQLIKEIKQMSAN